MTVLNIALGIYGLGIMLTMILVGIFMYATVLANKFSLINLLKFPLYLTIGFLCGLVWPLMVVKDESFREFLIGFGRVAIAFGYVVSAMFTMIYPWVWVWYISGVVAFILLECYHAKYSPKTKNVLLQPRE